MDPRKGLDLNTLNGVTFGCNVDRDYSPDYLVSGDATIIKEICESGYPENNKCSSWLWPTIKEYKESLLLGFQQTHNIKESNIEQYNHIWYLVLIGKMLKK